MRVLVGDIQRVVVGSPVVRADHRARLHRVGHEPVVGQIQLGDMGGTGESGIDLSFVTKGPFVAAVVRCGIMKGSCLDGVGHPDDSAEHVVVHFDQLGSVFGLLQRLGHDHGHVVAHITHFALRKNRMRRLLHRRAVGAGNQPAAGQTIDLVGRHISAHKHIQNPGRGFGGRGVDADNVGVGMWRPHEHRIALRGQRDVIGVLPASGEETVVFLATNRSADIRQVDEIGCTHLCTPENNLVWLATACRAAIFGKNDPCLLLKARPV